MVSNRTCDSRRPGSSLLAAAAAVVAVLTGLPAPALAIGPADETCTTLAPSTVELTFGTPDENATTASLVREVRARLGFAPEAPADLGTGSTRAPDLLLDTTDLPDLCVNWSVLGFPAGRADGRPYLVDTTQVVVAGDSGTVDLRAALGELSDPGCDLRTELYVGETLGDDDEAGAARGGPDGDGLTRAAVLLAHGSDPHAPTRPCGSATARTAVACVADDATLTVVVAGTTEDGDYLLTVDGTAVAAAALTITRGEAPQTVELTVEVAAGRHEVTVSLDGAPLVVDEPGRTAHPTDEPAVVEVPDCTSATAGRDGSSDPAVAPDATAAVTVAKTSDADADGGFTDLEFATVEGSDVRFRLEVTNSGAVDGLVRLYDRLDDGTELFLFGRAADATPDPAATCVDADGAAFAADEVLVAGASMTCTFTLDGYSPGGLVDRINVVHVELLAEDGDGTGTATVLATAQDATSVSSNVVLDDGDDVAVDGAAGDDEPEAVAVTGGTTPVPVTIAFAVVAIGLLALRPEAHRSADD